MSVEPHTTTKHEQGTTKSYIIGFILSLVFTIIPYFMVVNEIISGNALLVTIISIAILQMLIQIFFFLHLGRGPKPLYNVVFFFATAGLIAVVIVASLFIMSNLYHNMSSEEVTRRLAQEENIAQVGGEETGACNEPKESHLVTIKDGKVEPFSVRAHRCDTLTIINEDDQKREIAFGYHPGHESYGGEFEVILDGRPETITLNQAGDFVYHDHLNPTVTGYFSVEP